LPFTFFEKELMMELNVAPCQLHPNAWALIRAFEILCNYFGHNASVDVFLHFFKAKNPWDRSWVSLNGVAGRVILGLYQQSFKDWKGRFYMISATQQSPTLLEGFPLYWVPGVEFKKPRGLETMAHLSSRIRALTKSRSKSTPGVKVNTRRRLGEETPSTSAAKRKRSQGEASPRWRRRPTRASPGSNIIKSRQSQRDSPIPMGRKDHGGSDVVGRPQVPIIRGSDKEKEKVASRP